MNPLAPGLLVAAFAGELPPLAPDLETAIRERMAVDTDLRDPGLFRDAPGRRLLRMHGRSQQRV